MPRYFFHIKRHQVTVLDQQGLVLANVEEAAAEAARRGQQIAASEALRAIPPSRGMIIIEDELRTVQEVTFERMTKVQSA
jgi:hypothetical protein